MLGTVLATPQAVAVPLPGGTVSITAAADALAASNSPALFKGAGDSLVRASVTSGTHGLNCVSYQRTYRGLPVVGGDAVIVTNATSKVLNTHAAQNQIISVGTAAKVSAADALATARGTLEIVATASAPRLVVLAWGTPRLAWEISLTGAKAGAWATANATITGFAGQTNRIRFETTDASTASLIEAGVDNVTITQS